MSDTILFRATGLWDREPVYQKVLGWSREKGVRFLDLTGSQLANMERAVADAQDADEFVRLLEGWLQKSAQRGDGDGVWLREGEARPLTREIPALMRHILKSTIEGESHENDVFADLCRQSEVGEDMDRLRRLEIVRETLSALVKCHKAQDELKAVQEETYGD